MAENMKLHKAADCNINDIKGVKPEMDCGHRVDAGPGVQGYDDLNTYEKEGKKAIVAGMPRHNLDQDVKNGPGVQGYADLNTYETDANGRKFVVGSPDHNMDQDVNHGPGIK